MYEALAHAARSDEVAAGAGEALAAVTSSLSDANAQRAWHQALSDAMWLLDVETGMGSDEAMRARFVGMVRAAHMRQAVPRAALEKALDVRLLEEAGVVKSGQQFFKALVLHNTRLNLTQPTWFLFSEGSEGYAKFAVELAYGDPRRDTAATLRAIIGHFSLHYGRCADVALDMWPRFPRRAHCVVDLLRTIPRNLLCQVVALRLQQDYQSQVKQGGETKKEKALSHFFFSIQSMQCSSDLINALVMLLEMDLVDLGAIYDALLPSDEDATKFFEEQKQFLSSYKHTGASVVSLGTSSSSAASLGGDADDEGRASSRRGAAPEETSGPSVSTPAAAASTSNVVIKSSAFPYEAGALRAMAKNQKFDLARRLLRAGHWPQASALLKLLVQQGLALCVELQHELALFVERMIEPLYRTPAVCGPVASRNPSSLAQSDYVVSTFDEITSRLLPVLQLLGPALGTHPMAHAKVCRLLSAWMVHVEQSAADAETRAGVQQLVEGLMAKILLPGLAFIKSNPAAAGAAFGVIKDLPFEARCRVYASWRRDGAKHVLVAFSRAEAETEIKAILRRLNAERAAIVAYGRAVGGISHSHPLLVFDAIVAQLQQYVNMIGPVVDFLRYQSLLARDALVFVLLEGLASKKKATHKSDGTNLAEWLSALATAIGLLYKKYKDIDARPLLQLLRNKLLDGSTAELTVLEHLVTRMSGLEGAGAGMSEKQAAAQAGSAQLKASARPIPAPPGIGASASRLRRALDSTGIAPQLLVLIVQTGLKNTIYTAVDEEASLKMISDAYDKAMSVWLQFLAFLEQTYEPEALSAALPSLSDLVLKHRLAPSEALTALRSVLRLRYSDVEWLVEGTGEPPHQQQQQQQQEAEPGMALLPRLTDEVGIVAGLSPALTPVLYAAFWSLRLSDIVWPKESYDDVTLKLQKRIQEATSGVGQFEEWDASKRLKEVDKIKAQLAKLAEDCEAQQAHVTVVRAHFKAQASEWLKAVEPEHHNDLVLDFLQHCIHFRSKMSAEDAIFCAEFVRLLEDTGTHFFSSANFLHHLVQYSSFTMGSTTENEAANFGRYLGLTLARINRLRANEDDFEATKKLVCFKKDFNYATSEDWSYMEYLLLARKVCCPPIFSLPSLSNTSLFFSIVAPPHRDECCQVFGFHRVFGASQRPGGADQDCGRVPASGEHCAFAHQACQGHH